MVVVERSWWTSVRQVAIVATWTFVVGGAPIDQVTANILESQPGDFTNVPVGHWSYRFLERFEAKGFLPRLADGIKPFSRSEVKQALLRIQSVRTELSDVDQAELDVLRREFGVKVHTSNSSAHLGVKQLIGQRLRDGQALLQYASPHGHLYADLLLINQADVFTGMGRHSSERVHRNHVGGFVRGDAWKRFGFRVAFLQTREQGSRSYWIRDDVFERRIEIPQLKGNLADFHEGTAEIVASPIANVRIEMGKSTALWGPSGNDNLGLSAHAPSFDMVRLRAQLGVFKLVSIAGSLRPCPDRPDSPLCSGVGDTTDSYVINGITRALERDKYLAAHRVEASVADWIDIGFHEVVVYGDRGPQLTYLNPLMFYWAAQSYQGDKDNMLMGLDVDIHPGRGAKLYLAYLVDDLKKLRVFSDDFANKFSLQAGLLWTDPGGIEDTDFRAEYTRIEPWIYTHKFPINTFRHFDQPLGHSIGPNADRWESSLSHRLNGDMGVELRVVRTRKGSNVVSQDGTILNIGGDLHRGWSPGDEREMKRFLAGNVHSWTALSAASYWRLRPQFTISVRYEGQWGTNVPLPPRWGSNVVLDNRTGYGDGAGGQVSIELRYGYL